ncbi:MAG: peptidase S24, partial [Candidatus Dadabacteria bacterium]|nr:peptidase S24 [Candidatus Dadabacteria bacterium]
MRLYIGSTRQFIEDTVHNQIADRLKVAFFNYYRYAPSPGEMRSWRLSLTSISQVFQLNDLLDHGVILEYQIPFTSKRLDCLITGKDGNRKDNAVIIELKQWEKCSPADGENEVITYVGGANREVLHPSAQVGQYATYLQDVHTAFYEAPEPVSLSACSYLHNYRFVSDEVLLTEKFAQTLERYPLFSMDDV